MSEKSSRRWLIGLLVGGCLATGMVLASAAVSAPPADVDDDPPPPPPVPAKKPVPPSTEAKPKPEAKPSDKKPAVSSRKPLDDDAPLTASKSTTEPKPTGNEPADAKPTTPATKPATEPAPQTAGNPATEKPAEPSKEPVPPKTMPEGAADKATPVKEPDAKPSVASDEGVAKSKTPAPVATPTSPTPPAKASDATETLSPQMQSLRSRIRYAISYYYPKKLNNRDNDSWEIMHSIIAYAQECEIFKGGAGGVPVNAVDWLCTNGSCKGGGILHMERGRVAARKGVNVQGHPGQLLAILAQSHVPTTLPMRVDGREFTLADLIESEKLGCETGMELTFKLLSLSHYLDLDTKWKNYSGQEWSIPRLITEELKAPIKGAACGGTHRLMGLAYAVHNRENRGEPVTGEYLRAKKFLNDYHRYTMGLQNPDGSFSTEWFNRRGARNDIERRLQTTGHIMEWLAYSLSREELEDPRVVRAVTYLSSILVDQRQQQWEIGHLGHGLHALVIYDERVFKSRDTGPVAERKQTQSAGSTRRAR